MAKRGRPTLYTPERIKIIIDAIKIGGTEGDACARAGIDQDTLARWKSDKSDFAELLTRARVDGKLARIGRIAKAGTTGDWRADAWYLERRWPEEYAQHLIIKITPEEAALLKQSGLSASDAWQMLMAGIAAKADVDNE
jgi:hypothetical protein